MAFQPVIKRARVAVPGFSADVMARVGEGMVRQIAARMDRAQDIHDNPAPALSERYSDWKSKGKYKGEPIRNLRLTGRTRRAMRMVRAAANVVELGFTDPVAANRIRLNARKSRQWGISPKEQEWLQKAFSELENPARAIEVA